MKITAVPTATGTAITPMAMREFCLLELNSIMQDAVYTLLVVNKAHEKSIYLEINIPGVLDLGSIQLFDTQQSSLLMVGNHHYI